MSATVVDPSFRSLPKGSVHFHIWRVEKMQLANIPREQYGRFYKGDSYIVLAMAPYGYHVGVDTKTTKSPQGLDVHIHFWLGSETTQDEAGVAAYKTVELDDYLGGAPTQHREVEGAESRRFLSYFKHGLTLLDGGMPTGFNQVTDNFKPRLLQVKGKRTPLIKQVTDFCWQSMNDGDVYVLDSREVVFVWVGRNANKYEKLQGAKAAQRLKETYGSTNIVIVEDGQEEDLHDAEREFLNRLLPLKSKRVTPASEAPQDETIERRLTVEMKLYRCSDESGTLKVTEVKNGPLTQHDLKSEDSFIIDNGECGIWVWIGKRATHKERAEAMRNAQGFIKKKGYSPSTSISRVIDGGEPMEFKALFSTWKDKYQSSGMPRTHTQNRIAKTIQTKFDAGTLHENHKLAAESRMVDDGTGHKEVWRIEKFDMVTVDKSHHGEFFSGDCYIVLYAYNTHGRDHYIIYYWLGSKSSQDERGAAALKTIQLDEKLNGRAVQVRVVQDKETPHFMAIFGGKIVVYSGGKASSFDGPSGRDEGPGDAYLLQVRGTSQGNTKAVQVELRAASLNSNDVFILKTKNNMFVWAGRGSTGDEREMAKKLASQGIADPIVVYEGQEKDDFWESIGGKEDYSSDKRLSQTNSEHEPRLFQVSNASGKIKVEEIYDFCQSDLVEEDVMLLDIWDAIFIWIGKESNKEEREAAPLLSEDYLKTDPAGRDRDTPIFRIKQGYEPPNFTGFFGVWDRSLWSNSKTFAQLKKEIHQANLEMAQLIAPTNGVSGHERGKYGLSVLLEKDPEKLPTGIDPTQKEQYLSEEEFESVFKMSVEAFEGLPQWKRNNLKKSVGLF